MNILMSSVLCNKSENSWKFFVFCFKSQLVRKGVNIVLISRFKDKLLDVVDEIGKEGFFLLIK